MIPDIANTCRIYVKYSIGLRPYLSASDGMKKMQVITPMKNAEPMKPILAYGAHRISSF